MREAIDKIHDTYYRDDPAVRSSPTTRSKGVIASLHDHFSNYFTPKEYKHFQEAIELAVLRASGSRSQQDPKGLRIARVFDELAGQARAGCRPATVITAVGKTSLQGQADGVRRAR